MRNKIEGTNLFWSDKDGDSKPETKQTVYGESHKIGVGAKEVKGVVFNPSTGKLEKKN